MSDITENDFALITDPDGTENLWAYGEQGINVQRVPRFYVNTTQRTFNVKDYGAVPDAKYHSNGHWYQDEALTTPATDNSPMIEAALQDIEAQGGGQLIIPGENRDAIYTDSGDYDTEYIRPRYWVDKHSDPDAMAEGLYDATDVGIWVRQSHTEIIGVGAPILCSGNLSDDSDTCKVMGLSAGNGLYSHTDPNGDPTVDGRPFLENVRVAGIIFDQTAMLADRTTSGMLGRHLRDVLLENCLFYNFPWHGGQVVFGVSHTDAHIHRCVFRNNVDDNGMAVHWDGGRRCSVTDNYMIGVGGVNHQANLDHGYACEYNETSGNFIYDQPTDSLAFGFTGARHITCANNTVIPLGTMTNYIVQFQTYDTGAVAPPEFGRAETEYIMFKDNIIHDVSSTIPLFNCNHADSAGVHVCGNTFWGGPRLFNFSNCTNTFIYDNFINTTAIWNEGTVSNTYLGINHYGPDWSTVSTNTTNSLIWMTQQPSGATF